MERRPASHTEEEELNQRRRLLNQARRGDLKAINKLFDLYQVRVYSGDNLKKAGKGSFVPPKVKPTDKNAKSAQKVGNSKNSKLVAKKARKTSVKKAVSKPKPSKKTTASKNSKPTKHR